MYKNNNKICFNKKIKNYIKTCSNQNLVNCHLKLKISEIS